jgi:hypothetical protein
LGSATLRLTRPKGLDEPVDPVTNFPFTQTTKGYQKQVCFPVTTTYKTFCSLAA